MSIFSHSTESNNTKGFNMSNITFTMLGLSGTGKTHACKSLFYMMERDKSDHKIYLTATGDTVQEKLQNMHFIRNYAPDTRDQFTCSGTEGVWELPLALCVGYRQGLPTWPILNVPIRDYAGGIVQTIASGMRDDVDYERKMNAENLMNAILSSDVLMLLADANILSEEAGPNGSLDKIKDALARDINNIFMSYVETKDSEFTRRQRTVILMLTKCDSNLIPEELSADDFQGLMARAVTVFGSIVRVCEQNDWPFAIVPTSACGNGNSYTRREDFGRYESTLDPSCGMQPYGFDLAFLYGLMSELQYRATNKIDDSAEIYNTEQMKREQRAEVNKASRKEQEAKWKLYRETAQYLQNHLEHLLNAPNGSYILHERSNTFFERADTDEEAVEPYSQSNVMNSVRDGISKVKSWFQR